MDNTSIDIKTFALNKLADIKTFASNRLEDIKNFYYDTEEGEEENFEVKKLNKTKVAVTVGVAALTITSIVVGVKFHRNHAFIKKLTEENKNLQKELDKNTTNINLKDKFNEIAGYIKEELDKAETGITKSESDIKVVDGSSEPSNN